MLHVCDCCKILDNDLTLKSCTYCDFCNAYICEKCLWSTRRIQAWCKIKGLSIENLKRFLGLG